MRTFIKVSLEPLSLVYKSFQIITSSSIATDEKGRGGVRRDRSGNLPLLRNSTSWGSRKQIVVVYHTTGKFDLCFKSSVFLLNDICFPMTRAILKAALIPLKRWIKKVERVEGWLDSLYFRIYLVTPLSSLSHNIIWSLVFVRCQHYCRLDADIRLKWAGSQEWFCTPISNCTTYRGEYPHGICCLKLTVSHS